MCLSNCHAFLPPSPLVLPVFRPRHVPPSMSTPSRPAHRTVNDRAKDFLTQRAVQQTMFCSRVLRDETTLHWLEDFLDHHGLDDLHHCDALRLPSTEYLTRLLKEPPIELLIRKPIQGRTTNKNPYIKRRYYEYNVDIVPRKIGRRVLEARKQIAEELTADIPCISAENTRLLELYRARVLLDQPIRLTVDMLTLPPNGDRRGSPFRTANFDLVKNYTIYLGLHSAIRELNVRTASEDARWLETFLAENGRQLIRPYGGELGAADEIVEKLFSASPAVREGRGGIFDPQRLAEMVLELRADCAEEWLKAVQGADQDQLDLERRLLEEEL